MTPVGHLHTLAPGDSLSRATELIAANDVNQLPVIDEGHLLGFVTRAGIMRILKFREGEDAGANKQTDLETLSYTGEAHTSDGMPTPKESGKLGPKHPVA